jgi:hypothetical protein
MNNRKNNNKRRKKLKELMNLKNHIQEKKGEEPKTK